MEITHRFTVPADIDDAWAALNHLELIASCFPGATLSSVAGNDFAGALKVKLGLMTLAYNGAGAVVMRNPLTRKTVIKADGVEKRGKGTASLTLTTKLARNGHGTAVQVGATVKFTGQPAQLGRGVIEDAGDRLVEQFASCVTTKIAGGLEASAVLPEISADKPPRVSSRSDFEGLRDAGPMLAKRYGPPLVGVVLLLWLVGRIRRR
ncbi:MAG: SRPBCC family protein [Propionibacteriaceae bacterium]|nr:SRPBCC family protein [Propionibacteriaceae bacterium]